MKSSYAVPESELRHDDIELKINLSRSLLGRGCFYMYLRAALNAPTINKPGNPGIARATSMT